MSDTPLVSIVIPTHNRASLLGQTIDSIRAQTHTHWEAIIVDDASTDETPALIAGYVTLDRRIQALRHHENRKLPAALNTGFAAAHGEYLTWLADDNYYAPETISAMLSFLIERPDVGMVYTDYFLVDMQGKIIARRSVPDASTLLSESALGCAFLYRRAVAETTGAYALDRFLVEDYDYFLRIACNFNLAPLHSAVGYFRRHPGSLTSQACAGEVQRLREIALAQHLTRLPWASRAQRADAFWALARSAMKRHEHVFMLRCYVQAWLQHPRLLFFRARRDLRRSLSGHLG